MFTNDRSVGRERTSLDAQTPGEPFLSELGEAPTLGVDVTAAIDLHQNLIQPPPGLAVGLKTMAWFLANPFLLALFVAEVSEVEPALLNDAAALPTIFRHELYL